MKSMMRRTTWREIRQTFGRFFAIFAIVALGVGFFAGVRITTPAMVHTVDENLQEGQLFDYRLISTLGWEQEDVEALRQREDVRYAEGAYSADVLFLDERQEERVLKVHSLTEQINRIRLVGGRMPRNRNECLVDSSLGNLPALAEELLVEDTNEEDTLDLLAVRSLTVVGYVDSVCYINFERGTTSIGTGSIDGFVYVPEDTFDSDVYTEIYVRLNQDYEIYSDVYKDYMDERRESWEEFVDAQAGNRYDRIRKEALQEIAEGEQELADKVKDGRQELTEAEEELADAREDLTEAAGKLAEAKEELRTSDQRLSDAKTELDSVGAELKKGRKQLDQTGKQIASGKKQLEAGQKKIDDAIRTIQEQEALLGEKKQELWKQEEQLSAAEAQLEAAMQQMKAQQEAAAASQYGAESGGSEAKPEHAESGEVGENQKNAELEIAGENQKSAESGAAAEGQKDAEPGTAAEGQRDAEPGAAGEKQGSNESGAFLPTEGILEAAAQMAAQLEEQRTQLRQARQQLSAGKQAIAEAEAELAKAKKKTAAGEKELNRQRKQLEKGETQYDKGMADYLHGKEEYEKGLKEYADGRQKYADGKRKYADGVAEYEDGLADYEEGLESFRDGERELNEKTADAEQELADARKELDELEKPDTWLLERNTNIGYACFENDSEIVAQVARVFPIFFVLVAALVCMTTMGRMVEEQRTQIGVLKALGYSEADIMGKYLFYSGSAAFLGSVFGYGVGIFLFPGVIWTSYQLMYQTMRLQFIFDWKLAGLSLAAALLCSMGTTWLVCRYELSETSASLMRPKAPKAGKRVLLEYVPAVWSRIRFLYKVSIRNLFRYKGRFFMMIAGIGGCTALLLTGFGIKDSIAGFAELQYEEIMTADAQVTFQDCEKLPDALADRIGETGAQHVLLKEGAWDLVAGEHVKEVTLLVPEQTELIGDYVHFRTKEGKPIAFPGKNEALVCNSLAERYGVDVGDEVTLRDSDMRELKVRIAGIFENHVYNYVFLSPETMEEQLSEHVLYNSAYLEFLEGADYYKLSAEIAGEEDVTSVTLFSEMKERLSKMMGSLNYIVILVIACAAGLAFIVLYNLTNINITERLREIATIKVLGFFRGETAAYVFRENVVLTLMGTVVGLLLGVLLHRYVMAQIVVDMVSFKSRILPVSFLYSVVLTFVFTVFVNAVMERKLEGINMAESLKSVE